MRLSLERSHHNTDMDQADTEHLSHESRETTWSNLQNVPFAGESSVSEEDMLAKMDRAASFGRDARNSETQQVNREATPVKKEDDSEINLSDISATF